MNKNQPKQPQYSKVKGVIVDRSNFSMVSVPLPSLVTSMPKWLYSIHEHYVRTRNAALVEHNLKAADDIDLILRDVKRIMEGDAIRSPSLGPLAFRATFCPPVVDESNWSSYLQRMLTASTPVEDLESARFLIDAWEIKLYGTVDIQLALSHASPEVETQKMLRSQLQEKLIAMRPPWSRSFVKLLIEYASNS